jgi:hypothetical protein
MTKKPANVNIIPHTQIKPITTNHKQYYTYIIINKKIHSLLITQYLQQGLLDIWLIKFLITILELKIALLFSS